MIVDVVCTCMSGIMRYIINGVLTVLTRGDPNTTEVMAVTKLTAGKRSSYLKVDMEKKAIIAKYAAENGIVAALGYFAKDYQMVH